MVHVVRWRVDTSRWGFLRGGCVPVVARDPDKCVAETEACEETPFHELMNCVARSYCPYGFDRARKVAERFVYGDRDLAGEEVAHLPAHGKTAVRLLATRSTMGDPAAESPRTRELELAMATLGLSMCREFFDRVLELCPLFFAMAGWTDLPWFDQDYDDLSDDSVHRFFVRVAAAHRDGCAIAGKGKHVVWRAPPGWIDDDALALPGEGSLTLARPQGGAPEGGYRLDLDEAGGEIAYVRYRSSAFLFYPGRCESFDTATLLAPETPPAAFSCPLCMNEASVCRALTCGHVFCSRCVTRWRASCRSEGRPFTCPVCRERVSA